MPKKSTGQLKCKRCGSKYEGLGCLHCIRVAQIHEDRRVSKAEFEHWFQFLKKHPDVATLWVQVEVQPDGTEIHHFSECSSMTEATISFCGLNMSIGKEPPSGGRYSGGRQQHPNFTEDPRNCPLCWDRLMNNGGGICADICMNCGRHGEDHHKDCDLRLPEPGELIWREKPEPEPTEWDMLADSIRASRIADDKLRAAIKEDYPDYPDVKES